jgi:hypothetical protein
MPRLMLVALVALSGCALSYVTGNGSRQVPIRQTGAANTPVVITIDGSAPSLCGPDDTDPQHTCPAQSGPDQR